MLRSFGPPSRRRCQGLQLRPHGQWSRSARILRDDERWTMGQRNQHPRRDPEYIQDRMSNLEVSMQRMISLMSQGSMATIRQRASEHCSSGMGRPMEQLGEEGTCCDWALKAGEIDSFCSSMPNQYQTKFWQAVEMIKKGIRLPK